MLFHFTNNIGFKPAFFLARSKENKRLKIGLIDADLLDHGTRHPNLALEKISTFCKRIGHIPQLVCDYNELISQNPFDKKDIDYDVLVMSKVFKFTKLKEHVQALLDDHYIIYGGTGFFEIDGPLLEGMIEHEMPDYHLYDKYIEIATGGDERKKKSRWDDYISYSIGFTTRGCIRHCQFCVNRESNSVLKWSDVDEFLDNDRPRIYLWDDNIMAAPAKVFANVMKQLQATGKPFQFRQGMDIRLMTDAKAELLSTVKYYGDYIFAFDHYRMDDPNERKQVEQTIRGLKVWKKFCTRETKLYVLAAFDSQDERDIEGTFWRIKILMEFGCLPYIMRFEKYNNSRFKSIYTQLARWCNQPSFFKKTSFRQYCVRNEEYHQGIQQTITDGNYNTELKFPEGFVPKKPYCSCYRAMVEFEKEFPEIAKKYYDLRFEDIRPK